MIMLGMSNRMIQPGLRLDAIAMESAGLESAVMESAGMASVGHAVLIEKRVPGWFALDSRTQLTLLGVGCLILAAVYSVAVDKVGLAPAGTISLLAVFVAALASSIGGFAFSAMCGAMLFHLTSDTVSVVKLMLLCSIANQAMSVILIRKDIIWRNLTPFVVAGLIGAPVGVWCLINTKPKTYIPIIGVLLIVYSVYMLFRKPVDGPARRFGLPWDLLAGFVGGVTGGFVASPGAPLAARVSQKGWDKTAQRTVVQPFILIVQFAAALSMVLLSKPASGFIDIDGPVSSTAAPWSSDGTAAITEIMNLDATAWIYLPLSLLGTWCGIAVFRHLTDRQFAVVTNLLLIVSGLGLLR